MNFLIMQLIFSKQHINHLFHFKQKFSDFLVLLNARHCVFFYVLGRIGRITDRQ